MTKQEILNAVITADTSQDDWWESIKDMLPSEYAKGYWSAKIEALTGNLDTDGADFRDEVYDLVELIA